MTASMGPYGGDMWLWDTLRGQRVESTFRGKNRAYGEEATPRGQKPSVWRTEQGALSQ